jgi:diguanylate cyclase (GGDEF)-like protein
MMMEGRDQGVAADLLSLAGTLAGSANPTDAVGRLVDGLCGRLVASECACLLVDPTGDTKDLLVAADAQQEERRGQRLSESDQSGAVQALLERARDWALGGGDLGQGHPPTPPVFRGTLVAAGASERGITSGLLVPLLCERQVVGLLFLGARRTAEPWDEVELALVEATAAALGQAAGTLVRERRQLELARELADEHDQQLRKLEDTNAKLREVIEVHNRDLSIRAHDMRSPIGVILGHLSMLERLVSGTPARQSLAAIRRQGVRLTAMLEDVVGDERRRAMGLSLELVDLGPWLANIFRDYELLGERAGVTLVASVAPELGIRRVDTHKLEGVLGNLVDNAIKYSGRGGSVWVEAAMEAPEALRVRVSDSGPGLTEETLAKGFQLWFRDQQSRGVKGTGVGLASVLELVELMGGHVDAANRDGGGATFTVVVPALADELALHDTNVVPRLRYRVVAIAEEKGALSELAELLSPHFEVVTAPTEREARWLLQRGPVDCAIVELDMPRMTGLATATALRREPELAQLPVVFTADSEVASASVRRGLGALEDVIVRPFEPEQLVSLIGSAIGAAAEHSARVRTGRLDPVTGLLARKHAEPELERELRRMHERGVGTSLLLVAVDELAELVSRHGEGSADALLGEMGLALRDVLRGGELVARWGPEELVCVLPGGRSTVAKQLGEHVAKRLAACRNGELQRSVSVGIAVAPASERPAPSTLLERARAALGAARFAGGGRVAVFQQRLAQGPPDAGGSPTA